tara:strand:+ start:10153 stop:10470 length:318 start_codon:yes stop_codon:yes gene_type:complete
MIEIDIYLGTISRFWLQYTSNLEKGNIVEGKKEQFLSKIKTHLPVSSLIYTDNPLNLDLSKETGSLIAVTHISDIKDLYFLSKCGQYTLLSFEHVQGAYTGLYSK